VTSDGRGCSETQQVAAAPTICRHIREATALQASWSVCLDKGIVIVGDIQIRLLDIELLTIKLRPHASVDKDREMGINWWKSDEYVTRLDEADSNDELSELTRRLEALEGRVNESS
jgi:hypothetical protein